MIDALQRIADANESVKGTTEYTKYLMETSVKFNGRWIFVGYSIPSVADATIKTYKGIKYIYQDYRRYTVSKEVEQLL